MKSLFIHLPTRSYKVITEDNGFDSFDNEVENVTRALESEGSCWIPVESDHEGEKSENHIFLTEGMKKKVFLRTVVMIMN